MGGGRDEREWDEKDGEGTRMRGGGVSTEC